MVTTPAVEAAAVEARGVGAAGGKAPAVEVRRSTRRRRTVSAYRAGDTIVVLVPARLSQADEAHWVRRMVDDITVREQRQLSNGPRRSDQALLGRARALNRRYLGGAADPASVAWVDNMEHRWASCTSVDRSIRVSARLRPMPDWVLDYVLVHELAHILVAGHDTDFWLLVNRYELTERARGYLEGRTAAAATDDRDSVPAPDPSALPAQTGDRSNYALGCSSCDP